MRTRTAPIAAAAAVLAAAAAAAWKCAIPSVWHGSSPSGAYSLELKRDSSFAFSRKNGKREVLVSRGDIAVQGHHCDIEIDDQGKWILIVDTYAGFAVYDAKGKARQTVDRDDLLTKSEQESCPGKWACHPEGVWLKSHKLHNDELTLILYNGRAVRYDLAKIVAR